MCRLTSYNYFFGGIGSTSLSSEAGVPSKPTETCLQQTLGVFNVAFRTSPSEIHPNNGPLVTAVTARLAGTGLSDRRRIK